MRFALKMGASIVLLVAIALGLVDTLNYFKYKTLLADLVRSRMQVATADLQGGVQQALSLGLSLADTRTTANLLTLAKRQDPLILSVAVYEATKGGESQVLYDTDDSAVGKPPPAAWIDPIFTDDDPSTLWQVADNGGSIVGATLVDRLVQPIGGIVLRYSNSYEEAHLAAMRTQLLTSSAEVLALAVIINLGGILLVFRPISLRLRAMRAELQAAAEHGTSGDPAIVAFGERLREAAAAITRTEEALDSVDKKGIPAS